MAGHDPRERKLFTDIRDKNRVAAEVRRLTQRARRWQERMVHKRGNRWQAQYGNAVRRAERRLGELRGELLARAQDLEKRIREEQKISAKEIKQFHDRYKKEVEQLKADQAALEEADRALQKAQADAAKAGPSDDRKNADLLLRLRRSRRAAAREARREARDVKKAEQEIASEERDEYVLAAELQRAISEIEALGA